MTKTKILKWKLSEKPTSENVRGLVKDGIITLEEARKIILDFGEVSSSDIEAIKDEIALLRKLVLELSSNSNRPYEIIKIIEREVPYYKPYYNPYTVWCSAASGTSNITNAAMSGVGGSHTLTLKNPDMEVSYTNGQNHKEKLNAMNKIV